MIQYLKTAIPILAILLLPVLAIAQPCPEYPKWERLMSKGKYQEAYQLAVESNTYPEGKYSSYINDYENFKKKYPWLCWLNFRVEPLYKMGKLYEAVDLATLSFKGVAIAFKENEPEMLDKFMHYAMELGEKELAASNIDLALKAFTWAQKQGIYKFNCSGYPVQGSGESHIYFMAERLGDIYVKKGNYAFALKFYEFFPNHNTSEALALKIKNAKEQITLTENESITAKNRQIQQDKEDEQWLPKMFNQNVKRYVGVVDYGNISIKDIANTSTYKSLAFNETGTELYMYDPGQSIYQVWDVQKRTLTEVIPFSELKNNPKGREAYAAILPQNVYQVEENKYRRVWINADTNLLMSNRYFYFYNSNNTALDSFQLSQGMDLYKSLGSVDYKLSYNRQSKKLFFIRFEKDPKYTFGECSIYSYNFNTHTLEKMFKDEHYEGGTDHWKFRNQSLVLNAKTVYYKNNGYIHYDLNTVSSKDLNDEARNTLAPLAFNKPTGYWYVGTDNKNRHYIYSQASKDSLETIDFKVFYSQGKYLNMASLYNGKYLAASNFTVDPSGKYLAYTLGFNHAKEGNYTSIGLYKMDEPDKLYTLNDNTKYQPIIPNGFVPTKEIEMTVMAGKKANALSKEQTELARLKAVKDKELAIEKRRMQFKPQMDSLLAALANTKKEIKDVSDQAYALFKAGKYDKLLTGHYWNLRRVYEKAITYIIGDYRKTVNYSLSFNASLIFNSNSAGELTAICESQYTVPEARHDGKSMDTDGRPYFEYVSNSYLHESSKCKYGVGKGTGAQFALSQYDMKCEKDLGEKRYISYFKVNDNTVMDVDKERNDFIYEHQNFFKYRIIELRAERLQDNSYKIDLYTSKSNGEDLRIFEHSENSILFTREYNLNNSIESLKRKIETGQ